MTSPDADLREQVRQAHNLTESQARRLVGTTREELDTDAEQLIVDLGITDRPGTRGAAGHAEAVRRFGEAAVTPTAAASAPATGRPHGTAEGLAEARRRFGDHGKA